jgi:hypothetical protein
LHRAPSLGSFDLDNSLTALDDRAMKTIIPVFHMFLTILCFGLFPNARAVAPPPDGCYPGFTTAEGCNALNFLTTGAANTGVGWYSLFSAGAANYNTGVGAGTLVLNTADSNTAVGAAALLLNTTGPNNTAVGTDALVHNDSGEGNTATGALALFGNAQGQFNTANGEFALYNSTGTGNTAVGDSALLNNTSGNDNIAVGVIAGSNLTTGSGNIDIGNQGSASESSTIRIGTDQTATFIAGIRGVTTLNAAIPVLIDTLGQLGTASSSRRFKKEIKPMDQASEAILALEPVTFHYKSDVTATTQFGLIAEEVAKVNPDLVVRDKNGEIYTVRYDAVNAMLLNEFLKEHKMVQELRSALKDEEAIVARLKDDGANYQATIGDLRKAMETVVAHLKKQDSKIQNVSDKVELNRMGPYTLASKP